eukprot:9760657-Alexandrium_andersonii.AAC.1
MAAGSEVLQHAVLNQLPEPARAQPHASRAVACGQSLRVLCCGARLRGLLPGCSRGWSAMPRHRASAPMP